jgi:hypothetical protein
MQPANGAVRSAIGMSGESVLATFARQHQPPTPSPATQSGAARLAPGPECPTKLWPNHLRNRHRQFPRLVVPRLKMKHQIGALASAKGFICATKRSMTCWGRACFSFYELPSFDGSGGVSKADCSRRSEGSTKQQRCHSACEHPLM